MTETSDHQKPVACGAGEILYHWRCPKCGVTDQTKPADDGPLPAGVWHCFVCEGFVILEMTGPVEEAAVSAHGLESVGELLV